MKLVTYHYKVGYTRFIDPGDRSCPYSREPIVVRQYGVIVIVNEVVHQLGQLCECCGLAKHVFSVDTKPEVKHAADKTYQKIQDDGLDDLILLKVPDSGEPITIH